MEMAAKVKCRTSFCYILQNKNQKNYWGDPGLPGPPSRYAPVIKNKKLSKISEVGKFSSHVTSLSFASHVFIFVFCISSNKLNSISCGICLFKSRHLQLFCKIVIQLFFTGIYLRLWSRGPPYNFTEQLFSCTAVHGYHWLSYHYLPII